MSRYTIVPLAREDMRSIWRYVAVKRRSPDAADGLLDRFSEKFAFLALNPLLGQSRDDLRPGIRTFVVDRFVILYYPSARGVEIAGVIHGSRDIDAMFARGER